MKILNFWRILILIAGIIVGLGATTLLFGQNAHGVITFEVRVNLHRTLPKDREEMKSMVPEFRTSMHELYFNATESLYKPLEEDEDEFESHQGGMQIKMRMPQVETYVNSVSLQRITQQEFMGKEYLIEDTVKVLPWKFGNTVKQVMGKECRQASYYDSARKQSIVAWYTFALRPALGPEIFNSLPGAVMEVNINDGERVVTAKSMEDRPLKKNELKIPKIGTKISQPAFRKMVEAEMERMRSNGGSMIIRN